MFRFLLLMAVLICIVGCGESGSSRARDESEADGAGEIDASAKRQLGGEGAEVSGNENAVIEGSVRRDRKVENTTGPIGDGASSDEKPITHSDLAQFIARSKDQSMWHSGERTVGELVGTWVAVDGSGHPLVFRADGSFSEELGGNMTEGVYSISDAGRIFTYSKSNGVRIGSHFRFDGKTLRGPRGPKPLAEWTRASSLTAPADEKSRNVE